MKRRFLSFTVILFIVTIGSCDLLDKTTKEGEAAKILNNPPFGGLTDSIHQFPDNADLHLKRGELLSQQNLHELALPDYKKAWELSPDETTALIYTANLFMAGKEQDAIRMLKQCVKKFPENPEFKRRLSEAYLQTGEISDALSQYNSILKNDSNNFEAWYEKGVLLVQLKDTSNAILAFEKAYSLQPLQLSGLTLANLYAETKNPKVLALCNKLIEKDSLEELADAMFIKGIYLSNINQPGQALEQFEHCIKRDWKFTEAYIEKGIILFNTNQIDEALKTFNLASKVSNTYSDAYYWMGRCYEAIGKKQEAIDNYQRALSLDRSFTEAREALKRLDSTRVGSVHSE